MTHVSSNTDKLSKHIYESAVSFHRLNFPYATQSSCVWFKKFRRAPIFGTNRIFKSVRLRGSAPSI